MIKIGSPQWLFMAEAEGIDTLVNTHQARLNAIVNEINAKYHNQVIQSEEVESIAFRHGITMLSPRDWQFIQAAI